MDAPVLLTPGPATTAAATRAAMLRDWGSWDGDFRELTASIRRDLLDIVNGAGTHVCVPMQGSGTFAVEAALGTLVPHDGRVLVPSNGAYCRRIVTILRRLGRDAVPLEFDESCPVDPEAIDAALRSDPRIGQVALVHCETGTGILNPLQEVAAVCARHGRPLLVDAMSSFGALPIDLRETPVTAIVSASGKCLEGVPGVGFVIVDRAALQAGADRSRSLSLDLHDQWRYMEATGQWRFTPPTHVVAALRSALDAFLAEGGQPARGDRYRIHRATLVAGMRALGFETFLDERLQSPIIVTFLSPRHPAYEFDGFYRRMRDRGYVLYPGKLTRVDTFRIGCIGAIGPDVFEDLLSAVAATLSDMGIGTPLDRDVPPLPGP
jgi:2-aminoethylphosphonate-pyruvate transaminase